MSQPSVVTTLDVSLQPTVDMSPRKLTPEEINDIIQVLPPIRGVDKEVTNSVRASIMAKLYDELRFIEITPLAIPDLKNEIVRQFENSRIDPGSTVGVTAAEALGGPITQMALNSFHSSGAAKNITTGVDRIKELVNLSETIKNPSCSIYFKDNVTFDDVILKKRGDIVGITVSDLVQDFQVDTIENLMPEEPWWYQSFRTVIRNDFDTPHYVLRLYLNVNTMYAYRVTMEELAFSIERDTPPSVICVYSPLNLRVRNAQGIMENQAIMDIYPVERAIEGPLEKTDFSTLISKDNAALIFISTIVVPNLDNIQVKGVPNIRSLYPQPTPVLQIVKEEIAEGHGRNIWFLRLNKIRMKLTGITSGSLIQTADGRTIRTEGHLLRLCEAAGLTVIPLDADSASSFMAVLMPTNDKPLDYINKLIRQDEQAERDYIKQQRQLGNPFPRRPATELELAAKFIYAESDGSNLKALLSRDDIDPTHTISNDPREILRAFGIEAVRNFLIREFLNVIQMEQSYVNPRHIIMLVEFMTNQGSLNPITFSGIQRQPISSLSVAAFERAMSVFSQAAAHGKRERVQSTSDSVYVGKLAEHGTGYTSLLVDKAKLDQYKNKIATEKEPTKLNAQSFKDAIYEMENLTFGTGAITLEGAELEDVFGQSGELIQSVVPSVTIDSNPTDRPLQLKDRPVVSNQLLNVRNTIQHAPVLPRTDTVVSIQPLVSTVTTNALPQSTSAPPPPLPPAPPVSLSPFTTSIGTPSSTIIQDMNTAQQIGLPKVAPGRRRPGTTIIENRNVPTANLGEFLQS